MEYDETKIEDTVLALLGVFEFEKGRVWKRYDFDTLDALHDKGFITQAHDRQESVYLTDEGMARAKALAAKYFGVDVTAQR